LIFKNTMNKKEKLKNEIKANLAKYIGAGFGVVASLAWNDAIKALIEVVFPLNKDGLWAKFIYAGTITILVVIVTIYFVKFLKVEEENKK